MPCDDITETLYLALDPSDRLMEYNLRKRTCGAPVGVEALLLPWLHGRASADILALHGDHVVQHFGELPEAEEFLYFKHLVAVQEALRVLSGELAGGPDEACVAAEISADHTRVAITAFIAVPLLVNKIKACGSCGTCGSRKKTRELASGEPEERSPLHGGGAIAMMGRLP